MIDWYNLQVIPLKIIIPRKEGHTMKKIGLTLLALSLCTVPVDASSSTDKKVSQLKKESIQGHTYLMHQTLQMNQSSSKEIVSIFKKKRDSFFNDYIIRIHEQKNGKWTDSYKKTIKEQHDVKFITTGLLGKYDHAVVGYKSGSRNVLSAYLIGSTDGKTLKTVQTKDGLLMGNAKIAKGNLYYLNRSITLSKYTYKKNKLVSAGKPNGQDDRIAAEQPKVWLGLEQQSGKTRFVGKRSYTVHVGDRIGIGRNLLTDTNDYEYSLHLKGHYTMDWDFSRVSLLTKQPGTTYLVLSPSLGAKSVDIEIIVKK